MCMTSSLFCAQLVCFLTFFEYEEKIFLKNINRLAFLMENYVFSVKCELKSKII